MGLFVASTVTEIITAAVVIIFWTFYSYVTKYYNYWKDKGVPYAGAKFPFGTLSDVMMGQKNIGEGFEWWYRQYKSEPYFGILNGRSPTLVVNDLDVIKSILVKDFNSFYDRSQLTDKQKKEYINHHLFNMSGQDWRNMRFTLASTFTSGKMKIMFLLLDKCSDQLHTHLEKQVEESAEIDVKDILCRFTIDTIASCAFGLDTNCLSNRDCEFYRFAVDIFKTNTLRIIRRIWYSVVPIFALLYAPPSIQGDTTKFFTGIINDTISYRRKYDIKRKDFLDLVLNIQEGKTVVDDEEKINLKGNPLDWEKKEFYKKPEFTLEEITAQAFAFFIAGFEAASSTASFCLYELACNQDVQDKLYKEVKKVLTKHGGKATYQALQEMVYMDQVINETLRLYPSVSVLTRTCTETYRIPNSDLILEKGAKVAIPISAIHRDPRYFPEPHKFDPQRFSLDNVKLRHPFAHLPFGLGPRMCIGMRFGLMQTKVALTTMLSNYKFDKTLETEIPIKLNKKAFITLPDKPVILYVTKRAGFSNK